MEVYRTAQVRFSENGIPYTVNVDFNVKPNEFVIVRLTGKFTPLHKAQVISVNYERNRCKHSIVCRAEDAALYRNGPEDVTTQEDLDHFLLVMMKMTKAPVVWRKRDIPAVQYDPHHRWSIAYFRYDFFGTNRSNGAAFVYKLILLGSDEILQKSSGKAERVRMHGDALIADYDHGTIVEAPNGSIYRRAAEMVEANLTKKEVDADLIQAESRSMITNQHPNQELDEIKKVVGNDGYLSDDVYI